MTKEEILQLSTLARITITDNEAETFKGEIDSVLEYVGTIKDIVAEGAEEKLVGARYNVLREDKVTNVPGEYSEDLLAAMPSREGQFMAVKKILNQDE